MGVITQVTTSRRQRSKTAILEQLCALPLFITPHRLHPLLQEVTDEQGRRRFHGAFTGGFSAGYFNTVGSKVMQEREQCIG